MLFDAKLMYSHKYLRDYSAKIINEWKTTVRRGFCMVEESTLPGFEYGNGVGRVHTAHTHSHSSYIHWFYVLNKI